MIDKLKMLEEKLAAGAIAYIYKNTYGAIVTGKSGSQRIQKREALALVKAGKARIVSDTWERTDIKGIEQ